jgi:hypothetical protein
MEIAFLLASIATIIVAAVQLYRWWKERQLRIAPLAEPPIEDKWVSLRYVEEAGISERLREQGYQFGWVAANDEARKIDIEGYEPVIEPLPDGRRVRYKVRDDPVVGGYLILLRKVERQP